jgi:hypothetical protein
MIFRWDLDKTYLRSEFNSFRSLMRIPFEQPEDKINVPGVVPVIRGLRSDAAIFGRDVRIYFITASPPQIGKAIKGKFVLDGIEYDGIVFKDQLRELVRGKFRNLREHVGFKIAELLKSRLETPAGARELLFGDDWESDAIVYSIYADVLAGRLDADGLGKVLGLVGVDVMAIIKAQQLAERIEIRDCVDKIYINLERRTPVGRFRSFGRRLVPAFNYLQTASCLFEEGHLSLTTICTVAQELTANAGYTPEKLANSLADIARRGHLGRTGVAAIRQRLEVEGLLKPGQRDPRLALIWKRLQAWWARRENSTPEADQAIDYETLATQWRASH